MIIKCAWVQRKTVKRAALGQGKPPKSHILLRTCHGTSNKANILGAENPALNNRFSLTLCSFEYRLNIGWWNRTFLGNAQPFSCRESAAAFHDMVSPYEVPWLTSKSAGPIIPGPESTKQGAAASHFDSKRPLKSASAFPEEDSRRKTVMSLMTDETRQRDQLKTILGRIWCEGPAGIGSENEGFKSRRNAWDQ